MREEEIIGQLKSLEKIKPSKSWKEGDRKVLFNYIDFDNNNTEHEAKLSIKELSRYWARNLAQPAMTVFLIILFVFGSSALSLQAARNTKPGDSLYIAKKIHEKTQITLAFSEKKKAELGLEFAGNRAKELSQVLKEPEIKAKDEKVEKLVSDFKKEISIAKERITQIADNRKQIADQGQDSPNKELPLTTDEVIEEGDDIESEDSQVFSANLGKDEQGMQLSDQGGGSEPVATSSEEEEAEEVVDVVESELSATTSEDAVQATSSGVIEEERGDMGDVKEAGDPEQLLNEAQLLLENQDYDATLEKLAEAGESIDQVTGGEVKGESEGLVSTTTPEVILEEDDEEGVVENGDVLGVSEEATSSPIDD